jgi:hypothetical protein
MSNPRSAYLNSKYARQLKAKYDAKDPGVIMAEKLLDLDEDSMIACVTNPHDEFGSEAILAACSYLSDISDATDRLASTYECRGQIGTSKLASQDAAALKAFVKKVEAVLEGPQDKVANDNSPTTRNFRP